MTARTPSTAAALRTITCWWLLYRGLLLAVALGAPGLGYDTSTALAAGIPLGGGDDNANGLGLGIRRGDRAVRRPALLSFARWDSIYFVEAARRGYVYEQEWAFSRPCSCAIGWLARLLHGGRNGLDGLAASEQWHALVVSGVLLSHLAHYASAVVLYLLGREVFSHERSSTDPDGAGRRQPASRVPLLAALLHVVSPAGVFLAAPNSEAAFALFSFAAMYAYAVSWRIGHGSGPPPRHASGCSAALLLASGLLLAIATLLRSNGLLSGCIFAYDFATLAVQLVRSRPKATAATTVLVGRMVALLVAGTLVFCAFAGPQVVAFLQFCTAPRRPWCHARIPSIYTFVQEHYWNVGLLRYWTLPNAPLFALAAPMLGVLLVSSSWYIRCFACETRGRGRGRLRERERDSQRALLFRLALPQLVLAIAAVTSYHVQIINRISSGYPVWLWFIGELMLSQPGRGGVDSGADAAGDTRPLPLPGKLLRPQVVVRAMVMYGLIQAVLYAHFLPPA